MSMENVLFKPSNSLREFVEDDLYVEDVLELTLEDSKAWHGCAGRETILVPMLISLMVNDLFILSIFSLTQF